MKFKTKNQIKRVSITLSLFFCVYIQSNAQVFMGGINFGNLPNYHMVFTHANTDANWQGATKGFVGNIAVNGIEAAERSSGSVPFSGTVFTNDATLGAWQAIINSNANQAGGSFRNTSLLNNLSSSLESVFLQINALTVTSRFNGISAASLNGLNTQNGKAETFVINITSGFAVSSKIVITGDASDVFIFRWDSDGNFNNGYNGIVKFQSGGAFVPMGGLKASNFIHVAGDISSSGGGNNPSSPYPQGPRLNNGTGALIKGGADFSGGGFFTGYWFTTGSPTIFKAGVQPYGESSSLSNGIFVGGWYSKATKFSMTSGTSGVYVSPNVPNYGSIGDLVWQDLNRDGFQSAGEPGIENVTVTLSTCAGVLLATTKTNAAGNYLFSNLLPGDYRVEFKIPTGFVYTTNYPGIDNEKDSDPDNETGKTKCITINAGENNLTVDAGMSIIENYYPYEGKISRLSITTTDNTESNIQAVTYPNPLNENATIEFSSPADYASGIIQIFSIDGKRIAELPLSHIEANIPFKTKWEAGNLPDGIYIYKIQCGERTCSGRMMIEK